MCMLPPRPPPLRGAAEASGVPSPPVTPRVSPVPAPGMPTTTMSGSLLPREDASSRAHGAAAAPSAAVCTPPRPLLGVRKLLPPMVEGTASASGSAKRESRRPANDAAAAAGVAPVRRPPALPRAARSSTEALRRLSPLPPAPPPRLPAAAAAASHSRAACSGLATEARRAPPVPPPLRPSSRGMPLPPLQVTDSAPPPPSPRRLLRADAAISDDEGDAGTTTGLTGSGRTSTHGDHCASCWRAACGACCCPAATAAARRSGLVPHPIASWWHARDEP